MSDLRDKRLELVLQSMESLPTLPAVVVRALAVLGNPNAGADELTRIIQSDPSLTARLLTLTRRADTGVRGEVDLGRAIVMLGFDAVRSAVLAIGVFDVFQKPVRSEPGDTAVQSPKFDRTAFWKHAIAVGCCAELLAGVLPAGRQRIDAGEAFAAGLLHDLGKIALDHILPKSFARVIEATDLLRGNIADIERSVIGVDHAVVGKRLAERWNLPGNLRDCIWLHGQDPGALPLSVQQSRLVNLITLADAVVRQQHLGYSGNYILPPSQQPLLTALGLSAKQAADATVPLVARLEDRCAALGLGESTTSELYQQALSRASESLGVVSRQLETKNKRLATRTKFFEALSDFHSEMRLDAPPAAVLAAVGQTAASVLNAHAVAVFSLPPDFGTATVVVVSADGETLQTNMLDAPPDGAGQISAGLRPAGASYEWLHAAVSPRLEGTSAFVIPLVAEHRQIGGVLWGAAADEAARLASQSQELAALAGGWATALRMAQIRDDAQSLNEQLAESNRRLQSAQEHLLRSRTLVSVGEMAAGAAHEMNNPLAVISGRSQLLATQLSDPRQQAAARLIHEQSNRLSRIITELMDFAQPPRPTLARCDLNGVIRDAIAEAKVLAESADRTVEWVVTDLPAVTIDMMQVTQAMAELIANALHATAVVPAAVSGGPVRPGRVAAVRAAHDSVSQQVVVTVTDDGGGMEPAVLRRAFDPFFSALPAGRRRGMGLPKALRWVEGSGGSIRLESRPGHGTRAVLLLPAAEELMAQPPEQRMSQPA